MRQILLIVVVGLLGACGLFVLTIKLMADKAPPGINLQNGDIIFQASRSGQSKAIQLATQSRYSHMGILYKKDGEYYVYEAVQPVKLTPLNEWIKRGEKSHYVVKRLKNAEVLTHDAILKMKAAGEKFSGKDYDLYFEWTDDRIYCSELVWKIYDEALNIQLGELQELGEFDLSSATVKDKLAERYGNHIPLHEKVISPARIFNSDKLVTVYGE
ncbi:MAG: YiiX family permuted papain-like enzyme [Cyclobacteriaceae bacterium]|nr:YiiX family permuted papain-like enzyme [Cyclobacteriaceae bacterium]